MGESVRKESERINSENAGKDRGTGSAKSPSAADADTAGAGAGTGTGTGTGTGAGAGTETAKKIVPVVATVDSEEQKRQERNAKRRERYAAEKAANGGTVKPRKVRQKKDDKKALDHTQLNAMLMTVSSIIAARPNCAHWQLSEKEVDAITTPLCEILAENEAFAKLGENSAQVALVMACLTIFLPRVVVTAQLAKKEKESKKNVKVRKTETDHQGSDRTNDRKPTVTDRGHVDNVPFYGLPLA